MPDSAPAVLVNTKAYWEKRFREDWDACGGPQQTRWFAQLALQLMPSWVVQDIRESRATVCDWGCAEGDGVAVLADAFPASPVVGADISEVAIATARKRYPHLEFEAVDLLTSLRRFDVVFSSNTLEHFQEPHLILRRLARRVSRYLILLIPFQEREPMPEHFCVFDYEEIPLALPQGLQLVAFRIADCALRADSAWQGKQALLVFASGALARRKGLGLAHLLPAPREQWEDGIWDRLRDELGLRTRHLEALSADLGMRLVQLEALSTQLAETAAREEDLQRLGQQQERDIAALRVEVESEARKRSDVARELDSALGALERQARQIALYESSLSLRLTKPLRLARRLLARSAGRVRREVWLVRRHGLGQLLRRGRARAWAKRPRPAAIDGDRQVLAAILVEHAGKPIIVFRPFVDWNLPLFQRPHHLARSLAARGYLYFYCTPNSLYDEVVGFQQVVPGCYLTDRFDLLSALPQRKILHLYSTDIWCPWELVEQELRRGNLLLYEYVDEIHEHISGTPIPEHVRTKHARLLGDESVLVVATADRLYQEVRQARRRGAALVTNGVDLEHFAEARRGSEPPAELRSAAAGQRPVIGYYGALARWFDYALVAKLAERRPGYQIVLIGVEYDSSLGAARLDRHENITLLGPVEYSALPRYACWFDVATIPFLVNDITLSTSPLKLFEYLALGLPVVATDLPECRKCPPVLVARDHEEFLMLVDKALALPRNPEHSAALRREAERNSWESKAAAIAALLDPAWGGSPAGRPETAARLES
jgi:teichuronic acid biosynthesis glycosyltransferase TuaH